MTGPERVICTVSSGSSSRSSITVSVMFFALSPGSKVRVPDVRV